MNILFAIFLIAHGIVHIVGFVVYWKIATLDEMQYKTTIFNDSIDIGDIGIRLFGIIWLLLSFAFIASGVGLVLDALWWQSYTVFISIFSLICCIIGWPDARIGVFINFLILILIFFSDKFKMF